MRATATHVGCKARATMLKVATNGAEQIAIVTPATVRMRPCNYYTKGKHDKKNK